MIEAVIGGLVGDYLLQNDWMAQNKKKRSWPCAVHCAIWTACVCLFAWNISPLIVGWLFATHFAIDRTNFVRNWMARMGQTGFMEPPFFPWSIIVVDNVFHLVTIFVAFKFMG